MIRACVAGSIRRMAALAPMRAAGDRSYGTTLAASIARNTTLGNSPNRRVATTMTARPMVNGREGERATRPVGASMYMVSQHFPQQSRTDLFFAILHGGKATAIAQPSMAALSMVGIKV